MSAPAPSSPVPPPSATRLSPVAQALLDAQHGGRRPGASQPGALPRGYVASPATRAQQRQLHGGARAYDRSPAGAGWAQRQEHARAAAHARSPAVGVRGGGAAPTEGSGPMPASYIRSPASRSVAASKPQHWRAAAANAQNTHYSHAQLPPHDARRHPVHREYPGQPPQHLPPPPSPPPPAPTQRPPQPRLQRANTAPVNSASRRGDGLDALGRAHSVAHEEYAPPSGYPVGGGGGGPGHMYPGYGGYPAPHAAYPSPHGAYPPSYPGYLPAPPPGYGMMNSYAPPSAARPLDPQRLSAMHRNGPRGTAPMREQLLQENASWQLGGRSLAPSATPLSPEDLAARNVPASAAAQAAAMSPQFWHSVHAPLPPPRQARPITPEEQLRRRMSYRDGDKAVLSRQARDVLRRTKSVALQSAAAVAGDAEPAPVGNALRRSVTAPVSGVACYTAREKPAWASNGVGGIPKMSPARKWFDRDECHGNYAASSRRHRAVVVGITYARTKHNTLNGALSDAREVFKMLVDTFGFATENIRVLCDQTPACGENGVRMPTAANIMEAMKWVNEDAKSGDSMFFYFAGHGSLVKDYSGDERDTEFDQCLVPIDAEQSGSIVDDHIFEWLIRRVPFGARLTCLIDSCTSGTVCDLPFLHTRTRGHRRAGLGTDMDIADEAAQPPRHALRADMRVGETLLYAGSADLQEAVDITRGGISFGVMTRSFIKAVQAVLQMQMEGKGVEHMSFGAHLAIIQNTVDSITREEETLKGSAPQEPQLSSSHRFKIFETPFSL